MTLNMYKKSSTDPVEVIGIDDEFKPGDICWLETPLNPTGEARSANLRLLVWITANYSVQGYQVLRG